ncbi:SPX domain-containing protein [Lipomyces kononenkoae]|uniref:SPX domain-containing protein n=1 Tax=Lipomyces kononenkoae TaxID=34357 RepID=A0ACC3T787_LIPKO
MKFAKVFQQLLDEESIPKEWVGMAIQYKALKKCINKVVQELAELGLEKETLQLLLAYERAQRSHALGTSGVGSNEKQKPKLVYSFEGTLHEFVPKITINLDTVNGTLFSAAISPEIRERLASLVSNVARESSQITADREDADEAGSLPSPLEECGIYISDREDIQPDICNACYAVATDGSLPATFEPTTRDDSDASGGPKRQCDMRNLFKPEYYLMQAAASKPGDACSDVARAKYDPETPFDAIPSTIELHLHSDSEFFKMLCTELVGLDSLHEEQEKQLSEQVTDIARSLPHVASPLHKRNDLYVWREIFRLYIDAGVFFSTLEQDHGERGVEKAKQQLEWFTDQLRQMNLMSRFKLPESKTIWESFWMLNMSLLQSAQFQTLNQTATTKILKKFDKMTALSAGQVFPEFYFNNPSGSVSTSVAKSVCFVMAEQLLTVIPQLDDYSCPVCYQIAFKPVRLDCGHVFCIRCLVKLQREQRDGCPICRQNVLLNANGQNIDIALYNQMLLYFPRETKAKQAANEKEITKEQFNQRKQCVIQ